MVVGCIRKVAVITGLTVICHNTIFYIHPVDPNYALLCSVMLYSHIDIEKNEILLQLTINKENNIHLFQPKIHFP